MLLGRRVGNRKRDFSDEKRKCSQRKVKFVCTRLVTYMRKQEEKSFRGLLKLFNRACDATGRPRYEDLWPPLPLRGAASAPSSPAALENLGSPPAMAQSSNFPEAAPVIVSPPPGLGWDVEERCGDATDALTRRSP